MSRPSHPFWGADSPLSALSAVALIVMASGRLSFALICSAALLWVYGFTSLTFFGARSILPAKGAIVVLLFLASFFSGLFAILLSVVNPLLFLGTGFLLVLIPPCCLGSGLFQNSKMSSVDDAFPRAMIDAVTLSGIIIAFSLIREPLGMGTLSIPGGIHGVMEITGSGEQGLFFPVRFLSVSAGALVLLGYGTAIFRYFRERGGNTPIDGIGEDGK